MTRLKCKRVPHSPYPPDLAIAEFDRFGVLKKKLEGIDPGDGEGLKSEILTTLRGEPVGKLKSHSITGSKDVSGSPEIQGTIFHQSQNT
jgi:hypothetical protein